MGEPGTVLNRFKFAIAVFAGVLVASFAFGNNRGADARPVLTRAPRTIEVKMTNVEGNRYEPKDIKIVPGDTVKWVASGGSHNVSFWKDSIPAGAEALLVKAMAKGADTTRVLTSRRFPTAGDTYSIVFEGMPKGVYKYNCTPHLRMGMVGSITVE